MVDYGWLTLFGGSVVADMVVVFDMVDMVVVFVILWLFFIWLIWL